MPMLAIVGGVTAAAHLIGAKNASSASKTAAKQQIAATEKAQGYTDRAYADQKALMQPYVQGGSDAFARLMAQHWGTPLPAGMQPGQGGDTAMLNNAAQMTMPRPAGAEYGPQYQNTASEPRPVGSGMNLAAMQLPAASAAPQGPQGAFGGAVNRALDMSRGGMVRVKAPTGDMAQFPEGSPGLQMALQKGAVRV